VKVLCSQEVVSPHLDGVVSCQVTKKASAPQGPWCVLCLWLRKGLQENMAWFEHIDFYAFSRGSFRKPARNLIEIAQRKSHPLEGSCQEAILLPYTTLGIFSLRSARHTPPPIGALRRIRVFILMVSALMRRTSHPSGSRPRDVSRLRQTSAPGIFDAPENPRFPAVSNRIQRTDSMVPSWVQL
jgi:hypothetical protein